MTWYSACHETPLLIEGGIFMSTFVTKTVDEWGGITYMPTTAGYTALVIIMLAVFLAGVAIFGRHKKFSAKQMAFSALAVALGTVTFFVQIIHMPMGGAVTLLSMFFVTLVGYWYGLGAGLTAAFAYGLIQLMIDPYIISVPQLLTDYVFSFTALGLSGVFANSKKNALTKGYLLGVAGRFFFAFLSGWIFFGMYASDYGFKSGVIYSLAYNAAYILTEMVITLIIINIPPVKKALARVKRYATE